MLTQYDEFPVHQSSRPFAHIPATDYNWDDGYFFGVMSAKHKIYLLTGMRVNPNTDMIGGYAIISVGGYQYSVRMNRCWRRHCDTSIGPLKYSFKEPLKTIQLTLAENDSELSFDLQWTGVIPAYEESHHCAEHRGRTTTDQTRYSQVGEVSGHIVYKGERIEVLPEDWTGVRDHSWGLYAERPPLMPAPDWLPPRQSGGGPRRALRFWAPFHCGDYAGFYHLHESETGEQVKMNDVFGTPFEGVIYQGWQDKPLELRSGRHELVFREDARILRSGTVYLEDENGDEWIHAFEVAMPPWIVQTMGYTPGSWKDGGTMHTYHGSEELAMEWDELDGSVQPVAYTPYSGEAPGTRVSNETISKSYGLGLESSEIHGLEYLAVFTLTCPDGQVHKGQGHIECYIDGRYDPYGFK